MPERRQPRRQRGSLQSAVAIPLALLGLAWGLAACGGDEPGEQGETEVLIETDSGPSGLPALRKDSAAGTQHERVPITEDGVPTAVYAIRVDDLEAGMRVGALATVTLTKCEITDYMPNARAHTACQGTKVYKYDPVSVESSFRLVGGSSAPDLSGSGTTVGDPVETSCTTAIHHCTIAQDGALELSDSEIGSDSTWLVYEVTAKSSKAASCKTEKASDCNVLAVETQKGTAMYGVEVKGEPLASKSLPVDTKPAGDRLRVLIDRGDKDEVRDVVYSVQLSSAADIKDLKGDQMEVASLLKIEEKLPQAPDVANYLVLSDKPNSIEGRYLISDSYNPGKTGNNGENCDKSCQFARPAAVTTILQCDIDAGRRYINFVADGSRARAKRGETVEVVDGGYLKVSQYYNADITSDQQSVANCNR